MNMFQNNFIAVHSANSILFCATAAVQKILQDRFISRSVSPTTIFCNFYENKNGETSSGNCQGLKALTRKTYRT